MNKPSDPKPAEELSLAAPMPATLAVQSSEPSVGQMLRDFIAGGITEHNVAAFERLVALRERMEERDAEKQFAAAFVQLQADMPAIQAVKPVPGNNNTIRYTYAPYEDIMEQVKPILQRNGFTVTFSSDIKDGRVVQTCTLQHVGGHKRSNSFAARIGKGPPGSSEAQGDGAASTYAKRFALCDALNIVVERDGDARSEGEFITEDKVQYLREQVKETGFNEASFLRLAGAANYEEISTGKYDVLVNALAMKARQPK